MNKLSTQGSESFLSSSSTSGNMDMQQNRSEDATLIIKKKEDASDVTLIIKKNDDASNATLIMPHQEQTMLQSNPIQTKIMSHPEQDPCIIPHLPSKPALNHSAPLPHPSDTIDKQKHHKKWFIYTAIILIVFGVGLILWLVH